MPSAVGRSAAFVDAEAGRTAALAFDATGDFFRYLRDENNEILTDEHASPLIDDYAPFVTVTGATSAIT